VPSTRRRFFALAGTALFFPLLVACGQPEGQGGPGSQPAFTATPSAGEVSPTAVPGTISHPTGPDELVLRIDRTGGLFPPFHTVTELPLFVLYGDGRVITQGPQIMIYPPPALPNLVVTRLTEEGVQAILQEAQAAGLLEGDQRYELTTIADAPTTTFTVNAGGRTSVVSVYALSEAEVEDPNLSPEEREARRLLREFLDKALSFSSWLPTTAIATPETPYAIERLQLVAVPADQATDEPADVQPGELDWPLASPLAEFGQPFEFAGTSARCGVVERAELAAVLDAMSEANTLTRWRSGDALYAVFPRPLLPGEAGCVTE
jgi:hypothetical protein